MKKILTVLLFVAALCLAIACDRITDSIEPGDSSSPSVSEDNSMGVEPHEHRLTKIMANASTCKKEGNIEFYFCTDCSGYFMDENAEVETTYKATRIAKSAHAGEKKEGFSATCGTPGMIDYWICADCNQMFADEACTVAVTEKQLQLEKLAHRNIVHNEGFPVYAEQNGEKEHWYCKDCDGYFLSADATEVLTREDIILYSAVNIPDFMVEIPAGRAPIVLQLSDTQIIDGAQSRPNKSEGDKITYATELIKQYCYDYLTEIITVTKPDFIIITGDLVYGEYDDNGSVFKAFVKFMDSFQIPWAPVFGNHENESAMGVDWQCEQLENAKYCLFEQKELTGNGNYSVGIMQDGKIKRVFYMLDTNGCTNASEASLQNGHTSMSAGFGSDQIEWYTEQIKELKALSPETKISFAYHIQQAVFGEAYKKYGFDQSTKYQDIYVDYQDNHTEGDFGYLGRQMKDPWDSNKTIYNGMKELGVDSIFVGHEHCNSASVVYEGIRFQYGQKSSEYDRYNAITDTGEIVASQIWNKMGTPLVGGSVIVLSEEDGSIADAYIYYCENAGGNVDWDTVMQK